MMSSHYMIVFVIVFFFFFQAEDGIRDVAVTGVQTCALPIFCGAGSFLLTVAGYRSWWRVMLPFLAFLGHNAVYLLAGFLCFCWLKHEEDEIGRASCRERV